MLVMRNFGYLGLHSVIHSKSSLARDRLVDFTGEIQIRRKGGNEDAVSPDKRRKDDGRVQKLADWNKSFVAEATTNGGRNLRNSAAGRGDTVGTSESELYAQELAALPAHGLEHPEAQGDQRVRRREEGGVRGHEATV